MTDPELSPALSTKLQCLESILEQMGSVLVAFSGGVDSTLLLKVASSVLADRVLAVTAVSETSSASEQEDAARLAQEFGVKHLVVATHELENLEFRANPPHKCYLCKHERFSRLIELAKQRGIAQVVDGENRDDGKDFRPGSAAARELGVRSPLREADLSKEEIREISHKLELITWNKPSMACLASRIPYHEPITAEKLKQVDVAETFLRGLGFSPQLRVRHHGDLARLELDPVDIAAAAGEPLRKRIGSALKELGFRYVALDLEGYSMGSMNRALGDSNEGANHGSGTDHEVVAGRAKRKDEPGAGL